MSTLPNAASVALIRSGKVLLIQRAFAPYQNLWTLPGGRIEPDETIEQCAAREIKEELGLTVFDLTPVMTQALGQNEQFQLAIFTTTTFEGQILPSSEIKAHQWIAPNVIGALRTTARLDFVLETAFALSR
ncbi:NUDIX domain-containing protein [Devosia rhodophyticola]|uniref:NUDIX domain-containing protein n=1 Tax=Devosia rhodophyticola TaxID=3026423 RepID=A0ABY7YVB0_9HYPH|nr:NUDIX domain-containing protein [Devosia rhodophyticola]WDR05122.1 NUDIX domain-containing protein [Devosia rhodophyticola]